MISIVLSEEEETIEKRENNILCLFQKIVSFRLKQNTARQMILLLQLTYSFKHSNIICANPPGQMDFANSL